MLKSNNEWENLTKEKKIFFDKILKVIYDEHKNIFKVVFEKLETLSFNFYKEYSLLSLD